MYEYEDDEDGGGRSTTRLAGVAIGVIAVALLGWFVVKPRLASDDQDGSVAPASVEAASSSADIPSGSEPDVVTDDSSSGAAEATGPAEQPGSTTTAAAPTVTGATATTVAPSTSGPASPAPATTVAPIYETMPDGSPVPVVALFGQSSVTLSGAVRDEAAKRRLEILAIANAKPEQDAIENLVVINPAVPRTVPVRVVELTSVRFPEGSAEILGPHALELDRVVGVMNALPNVTVLVIGHGDQGGDPLASYALSKERANAVVNHLASGGISPMRLSARAVGDADLLTLNDDAAALELNRRTEFVFTGLLIEP